MDGFKHSEVFIKGTTPCERKQGRNRKRLGEPSDCPADLTLGREGGWKHPRCLHTEEDVAKLPSQSQVSQEQTPFVPCWAQTLERSSTVPGRCGLGSGQVMDFREQQLGILAVGSSQLPQALLEVSLPLSLDCLG